MAVITVPAAGIQVSNVTLNDTLQAGSDVSPSSVTYYFVDGASTLRSLYIGTAIEVDVGQFSSASLRGTGTITGDNNPAVTLPALGNYGILDVNGAIDVALNNNNQLIVSTGERLDVEGDLSGLSASTVTVAPGAELDLNGPSFAIVSALSSQGTLKISAPSTAFSGATTLAGTVLVQGDALNAVGSGVPAPRSTGSTYVSTLDLRQATLSAPISSLTLLQDAQIRFGTGTSTVQRLVVTGSPSALVPLDVVNADGTVNVTGDGSGTANHIVISGAEFAGGNTIDFNVSAADGGASLQNQVVADANTTLRNDGSMTIGGQGAAATIGAATAAAGSSFVNGAAGQLTIMAGAALGVAAIQNAGAIAVAGNTTIFQPLTNTGSVDVMAGTLALEARVQGAGSITVENGATLAVDAASSQGTVALHSGGTLKLSQPSSFTDTIQTSSSGAKIDLVGVTATAATVSNGSIAVTTSTGMINLAETGLINGTTLALSSDGGTGSLLAVAAPVTTASPSNVYRFFDDIHGTHFLTASLAESQAVQATRSDLVYEGVGLRADDPTVDSAAAPVFRFFDTRFGTHFYTSSTTERDAVTAGRSDLTYEGVGFYEHNTAQAGDVPVYRFFDTVYGTHFYTSSATEQAAVISTRPDLVSEGIGFYAPST